MQSYKNHLRLSRLYHFVAYPILLAILVISIVNLCYQYQQGVCLYEPILLCLLGLVLPIIAFKARGFALRAQDRAIRAEENLRYFAKTGKLLDKRLNIKQVIALRFASEEEFVALADKAAAEGLSPSEIKKSIQHWKADHHRV